ncbi:MAG: hypothetical protein A2787_03800 [Omnitrophica WOR_2 bacterium RIFCSPHIGHO2_01_FULL_48_9]|nr:MAG: hypothetical protein A3D10_02440 [Omnitrophica WOR_2 bacterium RIFCSPHIGHO2_02_FULL_48_11]OGX30124.1 MAG: hypothetical protein A2787_03800 [Omnitrophica WOR_2 bacterium RIFCSPHIGHO2_01_FULL_48_9]
MKLRNFYRIIIFVFIAIFIVSLPSAEAKRKKKVYAPLSAKSAIVYDVTNSRRLFGKNINTRVLPASTAKIMTALLVLERLPLDRVVTISQWATAPPPSKLNLRSGEKYKVAELLYGILLNSANDASVALAEAVAGSEWEFVQLMNQRARQLGAKNTKFANSSGLPTSKVSQYTTAYDMCLIFRAALKNAFFRQAVHTSRKTIHSLAGRKIYLKSHNNSLFMADWKKKVYGKTGYTRAAGGCFVGTIKKGERTLIVAVFKSARRWDYIKYVLKKYAGVNVAAGK